ncbi:hypothetical protein N8959_01410 [bacterium]|nr:hypothetical protein [bacterium]
MDINKAKKIFKGNFIGPDKLNAICNNLNFNLPSKTPKIDIDITGINPMDYILILGVDILEDNTPINIKKLFSIFGIQSSTKKIGFYNQDWYLDEQFAKVNLSNKWYLVQKNVNETTRGKLPENNHEKYLPSAILCSYTFFIWWLIKGEILWKNDFIWCSDEDRHGDRVYVGKYLDQDDNSRSGFSIHRHLKIKSNYGCIKSL